MDPMFKTSSGYQEMKRLLFRIVNIHVPITQLAAKLEILIPSIVIYLFLNYSDKHPVIHLIFLIRPQSC